MNLGSLTTKFCCLISNHQSSTLRLLHCVRATWLCCERNFNSQTVPPIGHTAPGGLTLRHIFSSFCSPRYLWPASFDRREILHHDLKCLLFYNGGPKIWQALPKKISGAKNMQNFARFRTTSEFDVSISGMDEDIQNLTSIWSTAIRPAFGKKVWTLVQRPYHTHPNFYMLENDQILIVHPSPHLLQTFVTWRATRYVW